jgi:adenosylcobinamide-phosphate synthase
MSFISVLIALLVEQARPLRQGNFIHTSMRGWVRWSARNLDAGQTIHGWLTWVCAVIFPAASAAAVYWVADAVGGWVLAAFWSVAVLYATLGFRQFSFHFTQIRDALVDGDEDLARRVLADWQYKSPQDLPRSEILRYAIEYSVIAAHRHVFAVLAWYCLFAVLGFGPAGAIFYRLGEFVARYWRYRVDMRLHPVSDALQRVASAAWYVIDWVPARLTAMSFAVVGSFEDAVEGWRNQASGAADDNDGVILAAMAGAINLDLAMQTGQPQHEPRLPTPGKALPDQQHLAVVVGLVWRTVIMWMVLLALMTLARLLG